MSYQTTLETHQSTIRASSPPYSPNGMTPNTPAFASRCFNSQDGPSFIMPWHRNSANSVRLKDETIYVSVARLDLTIPSFAHILLLVLDAKDAETNPYLRSPLLLLVLSDVKEGNPLALTANMQIVNLRRVAMISVQTILSRIESRVCPPSCIHGVGPISPYLRNTLPAS